MIAFLSCLNLASHCIYLCLPCLSLPTLVPQGYSALFVSILSGKSKELITMMKARGYSGEKASGMIYIRLVWARDHIIYDLLIDRPCRTYSDAMTCTVAHCAWPSGAAN